ncbi:MAG: hypothetical protein AABX33_00615 [Nanoarchaeota archaeon]
MNLLGQSPRYPLYVMAKSIIVKSQLKEHSQPNGKQLCVSDEFYKALEEKVKKSVEGACKRARQNSRNTSMEMDL